jgi:hypothetical protein
MEVIMENENNLPSLISILLLTIREGENFGAENKHTHLKRSLSTILDSSLEKRQKKIIQALKEIGSDPKLKTLLIRKIKTSGVDLQEAIGIAFSELEDESQDSADKGRLFVCPVDRTHYRKRSIGTTPVLICPLHNLALIPEDELLNK